MIALTNMRVCDEMFEDILVSPSKHVPVCVRFIHVDLCLSHKSGHSLFVCLADSTVSETLVLSAEIWHLTLDAGGKSRAFREIGSPALIIARLIILGAEFRRLAAVDHVHPHVRSHPPALRETRDIRWRLRRFDVEGER